MLEILHDLASSVADSPQGSVVGFLSTLLGLLGIALRHFEQQKRLREKRMQSVPPTQINDAVKEITGAHKALDERLAKLERDTVMTHDVWTKEDLRARLAEVGADHAKTAGALVVEREKAAVLERKIDALNTELADARVAKVAMRYELEERDFHIGQLIKKVADMERERNDCESRCLDLRDQLTRLEPQPRDEELIITPLRPPPIPK